MDNADGFLSGLLRRLGEAVLSGFITLALFFAVASVSPWGGAVAVLAPLPLTLTTARNGMGVGVIGLLVLFLVLGGRVSIGAALASIVELGALALVLGEGLRRRWRSEQTVVLGVLGAASGALLVILPKIYRLPGRWSESLEQHLSLRLEEFGGIWGETKLAPESWGFIKAFLLETYPSLIFLALLFTALINFYLARWMGQRLFSSTVIADRPFSTWSISDKWVWGFILSLSSYLLAFPSRRTGSNLLLAFAGLYLVQGLAILSSFLQHWKVSLPLRAPIYLVSLSHPFFLCGLAMMGLADVWLNLRRWTHSSLLRGN